MDHLRDKKQKVLRRLIPESVIKEIKCFVLYDHHPMDDKQLDITICTKYELQEYYQRELRCSIQINNASKIQILRNLKCGLHYLVYTNNDIIILSSKKEQISILQSVSSVNNVSIEDYACTGQPVLKIIQENDALPPPIFDNNFEIVNSRLTFRQPDSVPDPQESEPIVNQLRNKFIEARYTTKANENTYKEYVKLRQLAAFSLYQKTCGDGRDSDVNLNIVEISSALKVNIRVPTVKLCNKKIVVILQIFNNNSVPMENVHILLHGSSLLSISYTTKLFKILSSHHIIETDTQIDSNTESMVIAAIDVNELKYNITSRLDFDVVVSYKLNEKFYLLPFESVSISALDTIGMDFDVFASEKDLDKRMLAIYATSHRVDLQLRYLDKTDANNIPLSTLFFTYLNMKSVRNFLNVAVHNTSPYHILHGVMVVFHEPNENHVIDVEVYTRHPSQALALIHYIYDKIPNKIIATTPEIKIRPVTNIINNLLNHREDVKTINVDYTKCGFAILKQIQLIREYLLLCIEKMNEKGTYNNIINYMALGKPKYLEFRQQVLLRGLQVSASEPSV